MIHQSLVVHHNRKSSVSEAYRTLRTNILFLKGAGFPKVILVTSNGPNEGKTTTSCNLALAFAQSGHKTVLIDADMRRPTIHQLFGLSRISGFSSVLDKKADLDSAIQRVEEASLDVITSGPTASDPTEMLSSKMLVEVIDTLKQNYDIIVIDTPPAGMVTDGAILATVSTGIVLVVKEGVVHGRQLARTKEQLERVGGKIIGTVFNMVGLATGGHNRYFSYYYNYYYYRYGYDYNYGEEGEQKKSMVKKLFGRRRKSVEKKINNDSK